MVPGRDLDADPFDGHFHYRAVIGKLNFLEKTTRPDISYAAHQAAQFSANPWVTHGKALKWLGRYLNHTRDKGAILKPDPTQAGTRGSIHRHQLLWQLHSPPNHGDDKGTTQSRVPTAPRLTSGQVQAI